MIDILSENEKLYSAVHKITALGFGRKSETELVDNLRKTASFDRDLSLVAMGDGKVLAAD